MNLLASLRYLVALHDHRHFGRAAQACHITQPALSNALRTLEQEFGTSIVKRGRSFAGFTPEGERVLASARRMLHEHELLRQDLDSVQGRPQGRLLIGSVPTALPIAALFASTLQARHGGIAPVVRSMSSPEIESGLESMSLDLGLGYIDRQAQRSAAIQVLPQYTESYFLLRKRPAGGVAGLRLGSSMKWQDAATLSLCLLTPEMHNRSIVDGAFRAAGCTVQAAIETNSVLTLCASALHGSVCAILPGALLGVVRNEPALEALPLVEPEVLTPMGFMFQRSERPMHTLGVALSLAQQSDWLQRLGAHSGFAAD